MISRMEMAAGSRERIAGSLVDLGDELGVSWKVFWGLNCGPIKRRKCWFFFWQRKEVNWVLSGSGSHKEEGEVLGSEG